MAETDADAGEEAGERVEVEGAAAERGTRRGMR